MAKEQYNFKRNFKAIEETLPFSKKVGRWIATNLLTIPSTIYEAASNVNTVLLGLVKKVGLATGADVGSRDFTAPEFDMEQIQNAYQLDGYVRQAVDKYVDLIFKAGYDIVGKNVNAVDYIKARLAYMAEVSGVPQDVFFYEVVENLIKFSNVVIAKARTQDKNTLPKANIKGLDQNDPIGAYFVLPVTTMQAKRDKYGVVKAWQQLVPGQDKPAKFKPEDIVHIYMKREPGKLFAYPSLLSVLDDVRALREIEERVLHMIFRNVHPLIHAKVGSKEIPGQPAEVTEIRSEIENMQVEGGLVTTDRVNIDTVNTKNVIDANKYLEYFEQRVFTGLGVSGTMMGRGGTANRSTSDNQKEEAVDRVKSIQRISGIFITAGIINELLKEGGFDPLNNPLDKVEFIFKDPDADSKIKLENHIILLYQSNAITENEMRLALGKDPIPQGERSLLWFPQYGQSMTAQGGSTTGVKPSTSTGAKASNTTQPANQSGKKTSPGKTKNSFQTWMSLSMEDLKEQLLSMVAELYNPLVGDIISSYAPTVIKNTQVLVQYTETMVTGLIEEAYGKEQLDQVRDSLTQVFGDIYTKTAETMLDHKTEMVAKETVSAVFDVFIENLQYITKQIREGEEKGEE